MPNLIDHLLHGKGEVGHCIDVRRHVDLVPNSHLVIIIVIRMMVRLMMMMMLARDLNIIIFILVITSPTLLPL